MAAPAVTFESLMRDIKAGRLAPVYLLHGEEGYYIDVLTRALEQALPEDDRVFNQHILYALEHEPGAVMDLCRRFPMGGDRQMVIVKECQAARADKVNSYHQYLRNPTPTTTLVLVFRGADAKGRDLMAAAKAAAVVFQSKKVADWNVPTLVQNYVRERGMSIDAKSAAMLHEFVGNDLARLFNEVDKLGEILGPGAKITPEAIERNIGMSKDFNTFELLDALAARDAARAMRIVKYFNSNPKAAPATLVTGTLFGFYSDLLLAHYSPDKSDAGIAAALGLKNKFAAKRFVTGIQRYNAFQVIEAIGAIRQFDAMSKGRGSRQSEQPLLRDLVYHLLTAPGTLPV